MEDLLSRLKNAQKACDEAYKLYVDAREMFNKNAMGNKKSESKVIFIAIGIILSIPLQTILRYIILGIFNLIGNIFSVFSNFLEWYKYSFPFLLSIAVLILLWVVAIKYYNKLMCKSSDRINEKINNKVLKAYSILNDNKYDLMLVPNEYWYSIAMEYIVNVIEDKRADSVDEAVNYYKSQLYNWELNNNRSILDRIDSQKELLNQYVINK